MKRIFRLSSLSTLLTSLFLITLLATIALNGQVTQAIASQLPAEQSTIPINAEIAAVAHSFLTTENPPDYPIPTIIFNTFVSGSYAVAAFTEGETGGVVILHSVSGTWKVMNAGGGVWNADEMTQLGVPRQNADELWQQLITSPE